MVWCTNVKAPLKMSKYCCHQPIFSGASPAAAAAASASHCDDHAGDDETNESRAVVAEVIDDAADDEDADETCCIHWSKATGSNCSGESACKTTDLLLWLVTVLPLVLPVRHDVDTTTLLVAVVEGCTEKA